MDGFGTVGASTVLEEGQEFRAYTFQQDGVRKDSVNVVNNTLFGLQGDATLTDGLSATVQGIAFNDYETHYDTTVDWAYLSYRVLPGLTLRGGKFRIPLFKSSELTYVGYARTWIRPALPFYGIGGFEHYTGGDLQYATYAGETDITLQMGFGSGDEKHTAENGNRLSFKSNDLLSLKAIFESESSVFSLMYFRGNSDFRHINPLGNIVQDTSVFIQMIAVEGEVTYGRTTLEVGVGQGEADVIQPDEQLIYAGASYQAGAWRPYLLYAAKRFEHKTVKQLPPAGPPPPPGALPPPSRPGDVSESIYSLGVRYDLSEHADVKFQLDRVNGMKANPQLLISDDPDDLKATVATFAVDVVF